MTMPSATQFGGEVSSVTLPPASMTVFVVEVASPSFEISGQVRDPVGMPLADVTVEATNGIPYTAVTDDYGIYRLSDLPEDVYTVSVTGVGDHVGSSQQVDLGQEPFPIANFTLTPRLSGTVRLPEQQGGDPVPGAAVWAVPTGGGNAISTVSDCEGSFVLAVAAGTYDVSADLAGDGVDVKSISAVNTLSGAACISFVLDPNPLVQPGLCQ